MAQSLNENEDILQASAPEVQTDSSSQSDDNGSNTDISESATLADSTDLDETYVASNVPNSSGYSDSYQMDHVVDNDSGNEDSEEDESTFDGYDELYLLEMGAQFDHTVLAEVDDDDEGLDNTKN